MASVLLWVLVAILVVTGAAGTVLPAIPGVPLVFVGLFLGAWIDGFQHVGVLTLIVLFVLTLFAVAVDLVAAALGAKRVGASKWALVGAAVGTIAGMFFGPLGLFLGPFVGALGGEYFSHPDVFRAGRVALGTWLGLLIGTAFKVALTFCMIGLFIAAYLWP